MTKPKKASGVAGPTGALRVPASALAPLRDALAAVEGMVKDADGAPRAPVETDMTAVCLSALEVVYGQAVVLETGE